MTGAADILVNPAFESLDACVISPATTSWARFFPKPAPSQSAIWLLIDGLRRLWVRIQMPEKTPNRHIRQKAVRQLQAGT